MKVLNKLSDSRKKRIIWNDYRKLQRWFTYPDGDGHGCNPVTETGHSVKVYIQKGKYAFMDICEMEWFMFKARCILKTLT